MHATYSNNAIYSNNNICSNKDENENLSMSIKTHLIQKLLLTKNQEND